MGRARRRKSERADAPEKARPPSRRALWIALAATLVLVVSVAIHAVASRRRPAAAGLAASPDTMRVVSELERLKAQGRLDEGVALVRRQLAAHPKEPLLHYSLGALLLAKSDLKGAVAELEIERERNPELWAVHKYLGIARMELGENERALESLERAWRMRPEDLDASFQLGRVLARLERYPEAEEALRRAAGVRNAAVPTELGLLHRRMGRDASALEWFGKALELDPRGLTSLLSYGQLLTRMGRREEGAAVLARHAALTRWSDQTDRFRRATRMPGAETDSYVRLALALLEEGERAEATVALRRAAELSPGRPDVLVALARVCREDGTLAEARGLVSRALSVVPTSAEALFLKGLLELQAGDVEGARRSLEASRRAGSWGARELRELGEAYLSAGRLAEAVEALERAMNLDPASAGGACELALARVRSGDLKRAAEGLDEAVARAPADDGLRMAQGLLAHRRGDIPAAESAFKEALRLQRATLFGAAQVDAMLRRHARFPGAGPGLALYRQLRSASL